MTDDEREQLVDEQASLGQLDLEAAGRVAPGLREPRGRQMTEPDRVRQVKGDPRRGDRLAFGTREDAPRDLRERVLGRRDARDRDENEGAPGCNGVRQGLRASYPRAVVSR